MCVKIDKTTGNDWCGLQGKVPKSTYPVAGNADSQPGHAGRGPLARHQESLLRFQKLQKQPTTP